MRGCRSGHNRFEHKTNSKLRQEKYSDFLRYGLACDERVGMKWLCCVIVALHKNRKKRKCTKFLAYGQRVCIRVKWDTPKVWDFIGQFTAAAATACCRRSMEEYKHKCFFLHYNDVENSLCTYAIFLYVCIIYTLYKIIYVWMCSGCLAKGIEIYVCAAVCWHITPTNNKNAIECGAKLKRNVTKRMSKPNKRIGKERKQRKKK